MSHKNVRLAIFIAVLLSLIFRLTMSMKIAIEALLDRNSIIVLVLASLAMGFVVFGKRVLSIVSGSCHPRECHEFILIVSLISIMMTVVHLVAACHYMHEEFLPAALASSALPLLYGAMTSAWVFVAQKVRAE